MTKQQLIKELERVSDDTVVTIRLRYKNPDGLWYTQFLSPTIDVLDNNICKVVLLCNINMQEIQRSGDIVLSKSVLRRLKVQKTK